MARRPDIRRWAFAVVAVALLAGCTSAGSGSSSPAAVATTPSATGAPAGSATPAGSAACTGSEPTIKIGVLEPYSGAVAVYGKWANDSRNLALKDKGDTIGCRKLEFIQADEMCTPEAGVNAANQVVGQVIATLGPECSGAAMAGNPVLTAAKIPHFAPGFLPDITAVGDQWVFREAASDTAQMAVLAQAVKDGGFTKVALANDTSPFATGEAKAFVDAWKKLAMPDLVVNVTFDSAATDFSGQIQKIKQTGADAIVVTAYEGPSGLFIKQARQLGLTQQLFGGLDFGDDVFTGASGSADEGSIFVINFLDTAPEAKAFIDRFKAAYGYSPGGEIQAYVGTLALIDALNRAGPDASGGALRDAIRATSIDTPMGHISWDANGDLKQPVVYLGKYVNGQRVSVKQVVTGTP